jgi:hypothetical protein
MVHSALRIWDKSGNELNTLFLDDFFKHDKNHSLTDPVVIYDNNTNRWFSVIMEISDRCIYECFIDVASSTTPDPNSNWNIFKVSFEDKFADYPMVGLSKDKLVFGINLYIKYLDNKSNIKSNYTGTESIVLDKDALLNNQTKKSAYFSPLYKDYFTIFPVNSLNTDCLNMEASSFDSKGYFVNKIILFKTCGIPSKENVKIDMHEVPVQIILPTNGVQPSINSNYTEIDTGGSRPRGPVQINDTIFTGYNTRCENNKSEVLSCIRIIKLNTTNNSLDFKDIFLTDAHIFYPAINTNIEGKLVVVFSMSNNRIYPSGLYATIDQNFSSAEIKPIIQGNANTNVFNKEGVIRFGDYFTSVNDPSNNSAWITGEYGDKNVHAKGEENRGEVYQLHGWSTFIANVK